MTKQQKRKKKLRHQQFKSVAVAAATVATLALHHQSVQAAEDVQAPSLPEPEVGTNSEQENPLASTETLEFVEEGDAIPAVDQEATTPQTRKVPITYTVRYVDRNTTEVVHSVTKTVTVETADAIAKTTVTENGAELVNDSQLEWYYVPDGNPTSLSLTVVEGGDNVLTYQVEGFGEKEDKERTASIQYRVEYLDRATKELLYSETRTQTLQTKASQATTTLTVAADALTSAPQLATYSLPANTAIRQTATITEGADNVVTFEVESADTPKGRNTRKVDYSAGDAAPYLTIENYTEGPAKGQDDFTFKTNGETVHLNYKIGYTRIAAEDLDLTDDAKRLGLTLDTATGYISGDVLMDTSKIGVYKIGFQSKTDSKVTVSATIKIISHIGFFLEGDDNIRGYWDDFGNPTPVTNFKAENYEADGVYWVPYINVSGVNTPLTDLTYSMNLPTTPFGYYVGQNETVADATSATKQYNVIVPLVAGYDDVSEFQNKEMALTIMGFEQLEASDGVAVELLDLRTADLSGLVTTPSDKYATLIDDSYVNDVADSAYNRGKQTTPYFVRFSSLPPTEGSYFAKFKVVDNLGLEKVITINFKTVERSLSGALTNADVRFTGTKDYINPNTNIVQVPISDAEQILGTVQLNKENAWVKSVKLPAGINLVGTKVDSASNPIEANVVKEAGTKLKPGTYTFEVKAVDGHFADNAPDRVFTFVVTDAIKPIEHQVWREGTMPAPIPVSMELGATISDIRVVNNGNHAYLEGNAANSNIAIYGLKRTTEKQTARVFVKYLNGDGTTTETFTDFTYEVLPEPENELQVAVTNAVQTVVEGERWQDMVITHTEGANLVVDTRSLPKGTRYNAATKTISGIGRYEGIYDISVLAEKDGVVKGTVVHLVVTPGVFDVPDETIEVTVLDKNADIGFRDLPDGARVVYGDLNSSSVGLTPSEDKSRITGTPNYVGTYTTTATVYKTASNGLVRSDTATLTIKVKGIPASLDVTNAEQTLDVGTAIQDIQITKDSHSNLSVSTSNLPPGVTYNKETGLITGTPTQTGNYSIYVYTEMPYEYGGDLDYSQRHISKTIQINVQPLSPSLTVSSEEQTFSAVTDMTPITLTNDERSTIQVSNLPDGVRYDPLTKTISGRPSNGVGEYYIYVSASMPSALGGQVINKTIKLKVTPVSPSLDATNDNQTVTAKAAIAPIQIIKDDHSVMEEPYVWRDYTRYNLADIGLRYDSDSKTITGNPTVVGTHIIKLRTNLDYKLAGSYSNQTVDKDLTLVVERIPLTIDIANQEQTKVVMTAIDPVTLTVPAETSISVDEWALPPGIRYNAETRTFEGIPTRVGTYTVTVRATPTGVTNNELTKTVTFTITNLPASISISNNNQTVQVGTDIKPSVVTPNQYGEIRGLDSLLSVIGGSGTIGVPEHMIAEYLRSEYGLTYDANTHTISGKPTKAGNILFRFRSWNNDDLGGEVAEETYVLTVTDYQSRIPTITLAVEGTTSISGTGVNDATITVTLPNGSEKTTTVADGVWSIETDQPLVKGQNLSARQQEVNKSVSDNISGSVVEAAAQPSSAIATVNPIIEGSTSVSGTGVNGSTISIVLPDGTKQTTQVTDGTWTIENLPAFTKGQNVVVTQTEKGKSPSDAIAVTAVPQITKGDNGVGTTIETETTTDPTGSGRTGTLVKIYSINEQGVKSDNPISTAFIPNGQDGNNGADGKSVTAVAQPDGSVKIVETDPATGASRDVAVITNGRDGQDGQDGANGVGTVVTTEAGEKDGKQGIYVRTYTVAPDGVQSQTPSSETFVSNSTDGSTPTVTVTPSVQNGTNGQLITINDGKGGTTTAFVANGLNGQDGRDGRDGKSVTAVAQSDGSVKVYETNPVTGITTEIATITNGRNGTDGKSVTAVAQPDGSVKIVETDPATGASRDVAVITNGQDGQDGTNGVGTVVTTEAGEKDGKQGIYVRTYTVAPDGVQSQTPSSETFVANGTDGSTSTVTVTPSVQNGTNGQLITINDGKGGTTSAFVANGLNGQDGRDGQDGKSVTAVAKSDGSVKVYETNPVTGITTEIATITNGRNGTDGKSVTAVAQPDGSVKIVETDPATGSSRDVAVITNGQDGQDGANGVGTVVTTETGEKDGKQGVYVRTYTVAPDGSQSQTPSSETFVSNGTDGSTPTVTVTPSVQNGTNGQLITINDGKGGTTTAFVANGLNGQDGRDGQDGQDGKSVTAVAQSDGSVKVYETNPVTGITTEIATINNGRNGTDGKSVTAVAQPDGSVKIVETDPATGNSRDVAVITNGRDGRDGQDGKSVTAVAQPDGSVKIVETDSTTGSSRDVAVITNGRDGQDGTSISVKSVTKDADGNTIIVLTDGKTDTEITLPKGDKGDAGMDGKSVQMSENPTLDIMHEGDTTISGRGIPGSTITVTFRDGNSVTTIVTDKGIWSVTTPHELVRGENIFTTQTEVGKDKSSSVDGTVIWKENTGNSTNDNSGSSNSGSGNSDSSNSGNGNSGSGNSGNGNSGNGNSGSGNSGNGNSGSSNSGNGNSSSSNSGTGTRGGNDKVANPSVSASPHSLLTHQTELSNQTTTTSQTNKTSLPTTGNQDSLFLPIVGWTALLAAGSIVRKREEK
ncbi:TPA: Ig-like domain-containing protein [Streptococcus suis]